MLLTVAEMPPNIWALRMERQNAGKKQIVRVMTTNDQSKWPQPAEAIAIQQVAKTTTPRIERPEATSDKKRFGRRMNQINLDHSYGEGLRARTFHNVD